jgi:hypothetical protein
LTTREDEDEDVKSGPASCPPNGGTLRDVGPACGGILKSEHVRVVRLGNGANCSSVGSVIDTLFLGAAVGGAIFAAVCAAMRDEPIRVIGDEGGPNDGHALPTREEAAEDA